MARLTSLNMLLESSGKDYLSELYGKVIDNVMGSLTSANIKNDDLSGDPTSGSVEAKRMAFAASKAYGTARTAQKGDGVKVKPVTISLSEDTEIVEELEDKDIRFYGVDGVLDRRAKSHVESMVTELESAFYTEAATSAGITYTPGSGVTAPIDIIEEAIQSVATVKNNFVKGCPRNKIAIVCSPAWYGKLRNYIDAIPAANVDSAAEEIKVLHGCEIYESVFLPSGQNFFVMAKGSIAQPVYAKEYVAEKIPLSNAYGVELFYNYGTKAVMPDLILKY